MNSQSPKPPIQRPVRPRRKLTTDAERAALAEQREAERLGRVAFHHDKPRDTCPYIEVHLRDLWLNGYDTTRKRGTNRPDMYPAMAAGFFAFRDGLHKNECPYQSRSQGRREWLEGWEAARRNKEKEDRCGVNR
jgi:ribosome modulation factor